MKNVCALSLAALLTLTTQAGAVQTSELPGLSSRVQGLTPILTYHDVIPERTSESLWFDVSVSELTDQIHWLKQHGAHFVSVDDIASHLLRGASLPKNATAITFADGYEGFYRYAMPILRAEHVPVAMFVHTDYVGDQHGRPKMTWEQLKELDREGLVTVCSQTRTHPADLKKLNSKQLREEMVGSKAILSRQLGHPVRYLAYPNGKYDRRVATAAMKAGYDMAFTEQLSPAEKSPNLYMVSRYVHTKYRLAWKDAGRR